MVTGEFPLNLGYVGYDQHSWGYHLATGKKYIRGFGLPYSTPA